MPLIRSDWLPLPKETQPLWRYMNFAKFVSLLQTKAIFFSWLRNLKDDPWEGFPSKLNFDPERVITVRNVDQGEGVTEQKKMSEIFTSPGQLEFHRDAYASSGRIFHVNCWHLNDHESDSQWKIYGGDEFSVAITTSLNRIGNSIIDERHIYASLITYYDPKKEETPDGNLFYLATHKRRAFEHEKEFRLIYADFKLLQSSKESWGASISVDLEKLVESVIVSPLAPRWFVDVVKGVIKQYGLSCNCYKSDLLEKWE